MLVISSITIIVLSALALAHLGFDLRLPKFGIDPSDSVTGLLNVTNVISDWKKYPYQKGLIKFPDDEGHHNTDVEWWYLNLHFGVLGNRYAGFLALVRVGKLTNPQQKAFLLFGLTDKNANKYYSQIVPGKLTTVAGKIGLSFEGRDEKGKSIKVEWKQIAEKPFQYQLQASLSGFSSSTKLNSYKPPLTEGKDGLVPIGGGINSYYYSLTRLGLSSGSFSILSSKNQILSPQKNLSAKGTAWLDHQWFNISSSRNLSSPIPRPNHEWFSAQVEDGQGKKIELVFWRIFAEKEYRYFGILLDNNSQIDKYGQFTIKPTQYWVAPDGKKYARSWRVTSVFDPKVDLTITSIIKDQLVKSRYGNFYEGATQISGKISQRNIQGRGFVELTHTY